MKVTRAGDHASGREPRCCSARARASASASPRTSARGQPRSPPRRHGGHRRLARVRVRAVQARLHAPRRRRVQRCLARRVDRRQALSAGAPADGPWLSSLAVIARRSSPRASSPWRSARPRCRSSSSTCRRTAASSRRAPIRPIASACAQGRSRRSSPKTAGIVARCAQAEGTFVVTREGKGEIAVLVAPAAGLGGMTGPPGASRATSASRFARRQSSRRPIAHGTPSRSSSRVRSPRPPSRRPPPPRSPSTPTRASPRSRSRPRTRSRPRRPTDTYSYCNPPLDAKVRAATCVFSGPQKWRTDAGAEAVGGIARAKLPFWLFAMQTASDPVALKGMTQLFTLARRLARDGFTPDHARGDHRAAGGRRGARSHGRGRRRRGGRRPDRAVRLHAERRHSVDPRRRAAHRPGEAAREGHAHRDDEEAAAEGRASHRRLPPHEAR